MGNTHTSSDRHYGRPYGYCNINRSGNTDPWQFPTHSTSCLRFEEDIASKSYGASRHPIVGDEDAYNPMFCRSGDMRAETFKSREEALIKARLYRDRNFNLALYAYNVALDFAPPVFRRSPPPYTDEDPCAGMIRGSDCSSLAEEAQFMVNSPVANSSTPLSCFNSCSLTEPAFATDDTCKKSYSASSAGKRDTLAADTESGGASREHFKENQSDALCETSRGRTGAVVAGVDISSSHSCGAHFMSTYMPSTNYPNLYRKSEQHGDADELAKHHALTASICDEVAQFYLSAGYKIEALRYYDRAVRLAPQSVDFLYRRGVVLQLMGEEEAAIDSFRKALDVDPLCKAALFNLGTCLMRTRTGRKEALQLFQQLIECDPSNDQVFSLVAHCYEEDGCLEEALAYRQRAVQLDPQNFRANRELQQLKKHLQVVQQHGAEAGAGSEMSDFTGRFRLTGRVS